MQSNFPLIYPYRLLRLRTKPTQIFLAKNSTSVNLLSPSFPVQTVRDRCSMSRREDRHVIV